MLDGMNPFSTEFLQQEIDYYMPEPFELDGLEVVLKPIEGFVRFDEYFNKQCRTEGPAIPMLIMDGQIWMSLTWMEVQSLWVPIKRARGRVVTAGLGMGYAVLRMAEKENVSEVVVYEIDPRVITFFKATQGHRPEMEKIKIIEGDVREMVDEEFDFMLMDPYLSLLPDEVIEDAVELPGNNTIGEYRFWGQEKALLAAIFFGLDVDLDPTERELLAFWHMSGKNNLYDHIFDQDYVEEVLDALGRMYCEKEEDWDEEEDYA